MTALDRALDAFRIAFGREPDSIARAPGRVNLIGEHVDYNEGFVLPFAINRDLVACAALANGSAPAVVATDDAMPDPYVFAVLDELRLAGVQVAPLDVSIAGDVPAGAGLSSSAALCSAVATAVLALVRQTMPIAEIAELCRRAERRAVGVQCGIMDPFTSLAAEAGHALLLDCRSLDFEHVRLPHNLAFVIAHSGASRELAGSAYNERVAECAEAAEIIGVRALRDATPSLLQARADRLSATLYRRARHVISEIERTTSAAAALNTGAVKRVGALMQASHESLRRDYEVSSPALDALVYAALQVPGVYGSRLTGAGFGGCTITLLAPEAVQKFEERVPELYRDVTGLNCTIMQCVPMVGASILFLRTPNEE